VHRLLAVAGIYSQSINQNELAVLFLAGSRGYAPIELDEAARHELKIVNEVAQAIGAIDLGVAKCDYFTSTAVNTSSDHGLCRGLNFIKSFINCSQTLRVLEARDIAVREVMNLVNATVYTSFKFKTK
jgi:hypothetical protein